LVDDLETAWPVEQAGEAELKRLPEGVTRVGSHPAVKHRLHTRLSMNGRNEDGEVSKK
jgi:hypothetical protein